MKTIELLELVLLITFALLLFFLFNGNPDLWDLLHAKAMAWAAK